MSLSTSSKRLLNTSRDGDSTTSLGSLFQCLITLSVKRDRPHLSTASFQAVVESDEVSPQPPFLQAEQPQVPQPLPISLVLQTLPQLRCPSLDTLQPLNVSLGVRGPKLNTAFEGHDHCPTPAGHTIADTSQDAIGFLGHLGQDHILRSRPHPETWIPLSGSVKRWRLSTLLPRALLCTQPPADTEWLEQVPVLALGASQDPAAWRSAAPLGSQGSRLVWKSLECDCQSSAHPRALQGSAQPVLLPQRLHYTVDREEHTPHTCVYPSPQLQFALWHMRDHNLANCCHQIQRHFGNLVSMFGAIPLWQAAHYHQYLEPYLLNPGVVSRDPSEDRRLVVIVAATSRAKADYTMYFPPAISTLAVQWATRVPLGGRGNTVNGSHNRVACVLASPYFFNKTSCNHFEVEDVSSNTKNQLSMMTEKHWCSTQPFGSGASLSLPEMNRSDQVCWCSWKRSSTPICITSSISFLADSLSLLKVSSSLETSMGSEVYTTESTVSSKWDLGATCTRLTSFLAATTISTTLGLPASSRRPEESRNCRSSTFSRLVAKRPPSEGAEAGAEASKAATRSVGLAMRMRCR
ncbi:hypothetical protein QYF61_023392 [Mycteria americana]|uniref:Uncharacterized protein n=1 Tax=Mycteria americana TaxID=33587 RepID=A0AAN7N795_MYCAM|nr:hypothetical protein QYF61_023392 [Mycteria americana]